MSNSLHVACIQVNFQDDLDANLQQIDGLIRAAATKGATLIQTPECSDTMAFPTSHKYEVTTAEQLERILAFYQALAQELNIWIIIGSLAVKAEVEHHLWNRCYVVNDQGEIVQTYDKIHLFDADLGAEESYHESKYYNAGSQAKLVNLPQATIGLAICYDVRFASLFRNLAQNGANILSVPAAFAVPTGQAHWDVLLRTRAIETGSFVLAAGQTGRHPGNRSTYGHSMIIDPWGQVIAQMGQEVGFIDAKLDLNRVTECRRALPSLLHDRHFIKAS